MASSTLLPAPANQALQQSPIPALRCLRVEESEQAIIVFGSVPSYYLKQLAQESLMPILAGRELQNRVSVVR
jgi:hypothetical protein